MLVFVAISCAIPGWQLADVNLADDSQVIADQTCYGSELLIILSHSFTYLEERFDYECKNRYNVLMGD